MSKPRKPAFDANVSRIAQPPFERLIEVSLTHAEHALLVESLRIAQSELLKTAETLHNTWPGARMVDTLRDWASEVNNLRERLEDQ